MTEACERKNKVIVGVYGGEPIDIKAVLEEYKEYADRLRSHGQGHLCYHLSGNQGRQGSSV